MQINKFFKSTLPIIVLLVIIIIIASSLFFNLFKGKDPASTTSLTEPKLIYSPTPAVSVSLTPSPSIISSTPTPTNKQTTPSPTKTPTPAISSSPTSSAVSNTTNSLSLSVPFTVQAPDGDWSEPWGEGCEEAVLLMVDAFNKGSKVDTLPIAETKAKIATMVEWEKGRFGGHLDLGLEQIATIAKEYMGYSADKVHIKSPATLDDMKAELQAGKPVIVPAAGKRLQNPYFKQPGPPYHAFVLIGFEGDNFIANENGTRRGKGYLYSRTILNDAIHDLITGRNINDGPMAYLVLDI